MREQMIMYTVKELIKELEKYPSNTVVLVDQTDGVSKHIDSVRKSRMYNNKDVVCIEARDGNLY